MKTGDTRVSYSFNPIKVSLFLEHLCAWGQSQHIPACRWWDESQNFPITGICLTIFTASVPPDTAEIHRTENQAYSFQVGMGEGIPFCFHLINYEFFWKLSKRSVLTNWLWKNCFTKIQLNFFTKILFQICLPSEWILFFPIIVIIDICQEGKKKIILPKIRMIKKYHKESQSFAPCVLFILENLLQLSPPPPLQFPRSQELFYVQRSVSKTVVVVT